MHLAASPLGPTGAKMPKFRSVPALFNRRGYCFPRSQRDQALALPDTTNLLLVGPTDHAGLHALREEFP
jgi:hypothetical protein